MGCRHPITTAKFSSFDDQTLINNGEIQMKNLYFATDGGKYSLGCVTISLGANSAFLIVEFADETNIMMRVQTRSVEGKGDMAKVLAQPYDGPYDKVRIVKKYEVLQNKKKWSILHNESINFMKTRPNYDIFENNCYSFVDYILERFAVNYDGIAKRKMPKPIERIGRCLKKYECI